MKYVDDAPGSYFQLFEKLWEEMSSTEEATLVLQRTPSLKHEPGNDKGGTRMIAGSSGGGGTRSW
jgi:hypothetical protein